VQLDIPLITQTIALGTSSFLRGTDALYTAVSALHAAQLISWDQELILRAAAVTPEDWLRHHP
jgi:hypothetical protein